jgi:hypothetical protein
MGIKGKGMERALNTDTYDVARYVDVDPGFSPDRSAPGGAGETRSPAPSRSNEKVKPATDWHHAAQSLAAMAERVGTVGVVAVDDASPPSVPCDQVFEATIGPPWGHVAFPEEDARRWAPDILHVQLPDAPSAPNESGRRDRIADLLNRVGKVVPPGGVIIAACDQMDFGAQQAFHDAKCGNAERVTSDLLPVDGIRPSVAIWQRPSPAVAHHLGQLKMPWLRAVKTAPKTYEVESWTGWRKTTANHPLKESAHLPRSLAALHAVVADGVQHAVDKNATNLLVVHHGDYLRQFATGEWDPQKPDLVPPSRRIRAVQKQLNQISFVREHRSHGIRWDSHVSIQPG